LERELAAVVAHLDSVQRALGALNVLLDSKGRPRAQEREHRLDEDVLVPAATEADAGTDTNTDTDADGQKKYGKLTEQIMDYFGAVGDADVRARDVAAALGRDTDSGSINAVRSTLDRLVGAARIQRAGRGLYRAKRS